MQLLCLGRGGAAGVWLRFSSLIEIDPGIHSHRHDVQPPCSLMRDLCSLDVTCMSEGRGVLAERGYARAPRKGTNGF